jgi:arylsulfatase A-like enzyme
MKPSMNRRDFLKLAAAASLAPLARTLPARAAQNKDLPNVIIILFDALCALNLSLHGYPRQTSPQMERFASRATVYHNHHSAGNFTTPSTASLFTGTYPWTHRALNLGSLISPSVRPQNLFRLLEGTFNQVVFTQNVFADVLLYQFEQHLDQHLPMDSFALGGNVFYDKLFPNDAIYGMKSMDQFLFKREEAHGSLFLSLLNDLSTQFQAKWHAEQLKEKFPLRLPRIANSDIVFQLDQVMDGVMEVLRGMPRPSLAYIHLMPPHQPYTPSRPYLEMFDDGWAPPPKKKHRLAAGHTEQRTREVRRTYDQFIANLDAEFGRLLDGLEESGALENSYVILTSDHGEIFERGAHGHSMPLVFEPNIRVPLLISAPGQRERKDVHALTSNVDLLPSLLHIAGLPTPEWAEGQALPELGGVEAPKRSIFVVEAKANPAFSPLRKATVALIRGKYKLVRYLGYKNSRDTYEFYNLDNDPEELTNRYPDHPAAKDLQAELDQKLEETNRLFLDSRP